MDHGDECLGDLNRNEKNNVQVFQVYTAKQLMRVIFSYATEKGDLSATDIKSIFKSKKYTHFVLL